MHLVAELFDNATAFSPPDTSITVEARRVGDRAVLQVEDRGIGMSPDQYADLNERLATPPMVDVAVSRMMGLVVVARLAARHGVKVELRPAHERGTVADVLLPSGVLVPRALAGRTHAPAGFPAVRPSIGPERRSRRRSAGDRSSAPPLALESGLGAAGGASGARRPLGRSGRRRPSTAAAADASARRLRPMVRTRPTVHRSAPEPAPGVRCRPAGSPARGLGAALTGAARRIPSARWH